MPVVPVTTKRRVQNPIPAKYVDTITKDSVYLINLSFQTFTKHRTYGVYSIPAPAEGQKYTSTKITGRLECMDIGDQKSSQQLNEAGDIAEDLARECNEGVLTEPGDESFLGVFVSQTPRPDAATLAKMEARLMEFYDGQIRLADSFWDDPRAHKDISGLHRRAAVIRHQTRPWTYESVNTMACPACGENLRAGVAVCKTCGAIVNEEKARKHFPERFASLPAEPADLGHGVGPNPGDLKARKPRSAPAQE